MDNNTILRIKVPAALYENVKKQLTLTEAAKGKAHYGAGMEVVKEKKTKVPKDGMKKMEEKKHNTQEKKDKMKKERTLDELKMAKKKLEARINEMQNPKKAINEQYPNTGMEQAAKQLFGTTDPFAMGVATVALVVAGVIYGPKIVDRIKGYYKALVDKGDDRAEELADKAEEAGIDVTSEEDSISEMQNTKEPVNEIGVLAASGAVALGLLGAYGLYKGIKWVGSTLGDAALELAYKLDTATATKKAVSRKERYMQVIQGIAQKFEGDQQLAQMYQNLPEYQPGLGLKHSDKVKMNNERTKQLKQIGDYIKSKLTDEELQYFADVSSILRTGELKTGFYPI